MDRVFWLTYLLFVGFLLTVLAACDGGGGAAPAAPLTSTWRKT
jgi:hypothetical protein